MKRLLLGELDQMHTRYNIDESIADYLQSINGKTAELFWLACIEGAHFGGLDLENQERAGEIGRNIGIAFQVFDDILDYTADSGTLKNPFLKTWHKVSIHYLCSLLKNKILPHLRAICPKAS